MLLFVGKEKIYFVFVVLKYSRRKYRNPPQKKTLAIFKVKFKKKIMLYEKKRKP